MPTKRAKSKRGRPVRRLTRGGRRIKKKSRAKSGNRRGRSRKTTRSKQRGQSTRGRRSTRRRSTKRRPPRRRRQTYRRNRSERNSRGKTSQRRKSFNQTENVFKNNSKSVSFSDCNNNQTKSSFGSDLKVFSKRKVSKLNQNNGKDSQKVGSPQSSGSVNQLENKPQISNKTVAQTDRVVPKVKPERLKSRIASKTDETIIGKHFHRNNWFEFSYVVIGVSALVTIALVKYLRN